MLEVQGSLDDLRDDLSTEYRHWKAKKAALLQERDAASQEIKAHEAELLRQKSARAEAERLSADLAAALEDGAKLNATREDTRLRFNKTQAELRKEIAAIEAEIEQDRLDRMKIINATHNRTEKVLRLQRALLSETLATALAAKRTERARAEHKLRRSREQSALLEEATALREEIARINKELQEQSKLLTEHRRLASQAAKVAAQRAQLEAKAQNCTDKLQAINEEVAALVQSEQADALQLQRCQALDAENQKMQGRINECRAARAR